jgi:hypothetical protein
MEDCTMNFGFLGPSNQGMARFGSQRQRPVPQKFRNPAAGIRRQGPPVWNNMVQGFGNMQGPSRVMSPDAVSSLAANPMAPGWSNADRGFIMNAYRPPSMIQNQGSSMMQNQGSPMQGSPAGDMSNMSGPLGDLYRSGRLQTGGITGGYGRGFSGGLGY